MIILHLIIFDTVITVIVAYIFAGRRRGGGGVEHDRAAAHCQMRLLAATAATIGAAASR